MRIADSVRLRDGEYFVGATRVTLRSIVEHWRRGATPEQIASAFPSVPRAAVENAISYYLRHRREIDIHFRESDAATAHDSAVQETTHAAFLADMRTRVGAVRPAVLAELREMGLMPNTPNGHDGSGETPAS